MDNVYSDSKIEPDIRDVLAALAIPGIVIGFDEFVHFANDAAKAIFGDVIEDRHYITVMRDPEISDAIETVINNLSSKTARWATTLGNVDVVFDVHIAPLGSQFLLATFADSTQVERSKQLRRDFVSNVSHELKTPLTSIIGFLETMRTSAKSDYKAQERFLSIMGEEANRMNRLVNDLMSLNRVESEERSKPTTKIDLIKLINDTIESFDPACKKSKNSLAFEKGIKSLVINADRDQMRQVISNLIENALKYGGPGKEVKLILSMPSYQPLLRKNGLLLNVMDQGPGIPEQHIPRLTERFYRVDDHRSRQVGGTGLGLSIVKHIIHRHRGRLRIKSEIGKGTVVSVLLPTDE